MKFVGFGDLHLDCNAAGARDPDTGVHIRVMDALNNLDMLIDFAIENKVDYIINSGDTYHGPHPRQEHKLLLQERVKRIVDSGIKLIVVIGNHDRIKRSYFAHPLKDFETLDIDGIYISEDIEVLEFDDAIFVQIPWQYSTVTLPEVDSNKPVIVNAHCTVWGCELFDGTDSSEMLLGKDFAFELNDFLKYDFSLLGHIHRQQVMSEDPPVLYPGSVCANTWGELGDHGFVYGEFSGKEVTYEILPFNIRPRHDLNFTSVKTQEEVFDNIPEIDPEAMYRLKINWDVHDTINRVKLEDILSKAFSWTIIEKRPSFIAGSRRDGMSLEGKSPLELLQIFFEQNNVEFDEEFKDLAVDIIHDVEENAVS